MVSQDLSLSGILTDDGQSLFGDVVQLPIYFATSEILKKHSPVNGQTAVIVLERKFSGHQWVFDEDGDYSKLTALDIMEGVTIVAQGGTWLRKFSVAEPYMFGAFGHDPSVSMSYMTNEHAQIQCAFNVVGFTGGGLRFTGGRRYKINAPIYARITRQQVYPLPLAQDSHISDHSSFKVYSEGRAVLVAGAPMAAMLVFQYNSNATGAVVNYKGPDGSEVTGMSFNCSKYALYGIEHDFTSKTKVHNNVIFNPVIACIHWIGSAQAEVHGNVLKGPRGVSCDNGWGGDLNIGPNDYYFLTSGGVGVYIWNSGNIRISGGTVNGEGIANCIGVQMYASGPGSIRHVRIEGMEWSGTEYGVYASTDASWCRIYGVRIAGNHATSSAGFDRPAINPGCVAKLINCDEFIIDGNFANGISLSKATSAAIITIGCRDAQIVNQSASRYGGSAWYAKECNNVHWLGGNIRDVAMDYASTPVWDVDNSQGCSFNPFSVICSNPSYGQFGIFEREGSNDNYSDRTKWYGIGNLFTQVGAQSRFAAL